MIPRPFFVKCGRHFPIDPLGLSQGVDRALDLDSQLAFGALPLGQSDAGAGLEHHHLHQLLAKSLSLGSQQPRGPARRARR